MRMDSSSRQTSLNKSSASWVLKEERRMKFTFMWWDRIGEDICIQEWHTNRECQGNPTYRFVRFPYSEIPDSHTRCVDIRKAYKPWEAGRFTTTSYHHTPDATCTDVNCKQSTCTNKTDWIKEGPGVVNMYTCYPCENAEMCSYKEIVCPEGKNHCNLSKLR